MAQGKILILMRHAEADWPAAGLSDFDRPLSRQGLLDAPEMGRRLKARGILPDIILCSTARRAVQSLEYLHLAGNNVVFDDRLYGAPKDMLLRMVQTLENRYGSAMLIGHNPGITWLARTLSGARLDPIPPGSMVTIRLLSPLWEQAGECSTLPLDFDYPEKRPA